ncbi:MAG: oligosaccharide flippase family protein [Bacteroidales bacterium]|nr:oligosaccharide flippase family protein [Bacteroidales bacterium]
MKRLFFTNILLLILLNITIKAFWVLGIDRTVQNMVGAEAYGFYFSLFSFSVLFNILLDFGITNYNNRRVAGDPGQLGLMIGNIFIIRFVFAIVYALLVFGFASLIAYDRPRLNMLAVLALNQFIASFIIYLRSNIAALQMYRIDSFLSVADRFLMILICGALIWGGITDSSFRIEWFVYSQTAAYAITFLLALVVVLIKGRVLSLNFDIKGALKILRESAPFALLSLFMAVYWRIDSVMLERMLDKGAVSAGIYAQAFRLLDAAAMIPYLFAVILLPMFSRMLSRGIEALQLLKFSALLVFIPAFAVSLISLLYSPEIMDLLYLEHVSESAAVLSILMAGYVPVSVIYIFSTYLTALGKMRLLNIMAGCGMLINLLLNFYLIPRIGVRGSAIASVSVQLIMSIAFFTYVTFVEGRGISLVSAVRIISYIAAVVLSAIVIDMLDPGWILSSLLVIVFSSAFPFITGLLRWREILSFLGLNRS